MNVVLSLEHLFSLVQQELIILILAMDKAIYLTIYNNKASNLNLHLVGFGFAVNMLNLNIFQMSEFNI
jgi:hypothetical protein